MRSLLALEISLSTSKEIQTVTLLDGTQLSAKLLILSSGIYGKFQEQVKISRSVIHENHSLVFGFNVAPKDDDTFSFDSVTMYPTTILTKVGFISFFWIQNVMRANMFTYWNVKSNEMRSFIDDPENKLQKLFPELENIIGKFKVSSKVEVFPITLDRAENHLQDGIVLIGDAYQSVCPATGTGLSKVLVDVDRLCNEYIPTWLKSSNFDSATIAQYYSDSVKRSSDQHSLNSADSQKQTAINPSLYWTYWRKKYFVRAVVRGVLRTIRCKI